MPKNDLFKGADHDFLDFPDFSQFEWSSWRFILICIFQGVLLKRHRVPKNDLFKGADREYWHWTDLNIGAELALYGRKVACQLLTFGPDKNILLKGDPDQLR